MNETSLLDVSCSFCERLLEPQVATPITDDFSGGFRLFYLICVTILGTMMCVTHFKRKVPLQRARLAEVCIITTLNTFCLKHDK